MTLADAAEEIQASTNPDVVGKRLIQKKRPGREWVIRGVLGDSPVGVGVPQRTSTLTIPVVVGDRRVGYLVITRYLDDFSELSREAFVSRLLATLGVFAVGIILSLYLSWTFSKPLRRLTAAARKVAAGDLAVRVDLGGGSEIASLSQTFNEMVERLSEKRQLEERLHFAERSTALGRLASAVAHEIRNPLNFINLSIDHVRERMAPADSAHKEDFDRILRNMKSEISRLNRLVGDFLSFGKPMRLDIRLCALDEVLARGGFARGPQGPRPGNHPRGRGGARPAPGHRRPRAAQDLLPEPDDQRGGRHARRGPPDRRHPRARRRTTAGAKSRSRSPTPGQGMTPEAVRQRLRALLLHQGRRPRPRASP